jgi:hypothetical protein
MAFATFEIHAGDFKANRNQQFANGKLLLSGRGKFFRETVTKKQIASVEVATEESVKRLGGTLGWGLAGGVLLGPVGLLAGLLVGGHGKNVTFVCQLGDGRKFLATADSKIFTQLQAAAFNNASRSSSSRADSGLANACFGLAAVAAVIVAGIGLNSLPDAGPRPSDSPNAGSTPSGFHPAPKELDKVDASGIGLRGILPSQIPHGVSHDEFLTLGESWNEWSAGVAATVATLYQRDELDFEGQEALVATLRIKVGTMQKALSNPEYQSISEPLSRIYGRLNRRVTLAEAILKTLKLEPAAGYDHERAAAQTAVIVAVDELEKWLTNDIKDGAVWLKFVRAAEIRELLGGTEAAGTETETLLSAVHAKLTDESRMQNEAQLDFIRKPKFQNLEKALKKQIDLTQTERPESNPAELRVAFAYLVIALEAWEDNKSAATAAAVPAVLEQAAQVCADEGALIQNAVAVYDFKEKDSSSPIEQLVGDRIRRPNLLDSPSRVCAIISSAAGLRVRWKRSIVVDSEWVTSPAGTSFQFGKPGSFGRPMLSFYVYGRGVNHVHRLTLKLHMNGSPSIVNAQDLLITNANAFLREDGHSLSSEIVSQIRQTPSTDDQSAIQSRPVLLHRDTHPEYDVELEKESGRYTALMLHLKRSR